MYYVAIDIGCIECGEESKVLGIFTTKGAAEAAAEGHRAWQSEHWSGQHEFEVHEVAQIDVPLPLPEAG